MYRTIYCPYDEPDIEALKLAKTWGLPIQIKESQRTMLLEFDKTKSCVISIPTDRSLTTTKNKYQTDRIIDIKYVNDFRDCSTYKLIVTADEFSETFSSSFKEKHKIVFKIKLKNPGEYVFEIFDGKEIVDTINKTVVESL